MNVGKRSYTVRVQIMMGSLLCSKLDRYCDKYGMRRSQVIAIALAQFLEGGQNGRA